jgi:hypothetical protein
LSEPEARQFCLLNFRRAMLRPLFTKPHQIRSIIVIR